MLALSAIAVISATGGRAQEIVRYYAVAVFASFPGATVAATVLAWRDRRFPAVAVDTSAVALVALVLVLNLRSGRPDRLPFRRPRDLRSALRTWVRRGRPGGVSSLPSEASPAPR